MPKTIRNQFDKYLTYDKLMEAHNKSKSGKCRKTELIRFNLKQEEYIMYLYEQLRSGTYVLKTDVSKYFNSINKKILLQILGKKIKDKKLMWLMN